MSRVYVAQENNRINYAPAEDFGDIVFLTSDEYTGLPQSLRNSAVLRDVSTRFAGFAPDTDLIIFTGNPVMIGYVFHMAYEKARAAAVPLRYLQWDRHAGTYRVGVFPTNKE